MQKVRWFAIVPYIKSQMLWIIRYELLIVPIYAFPFANIALHQEQYGKIALHNKDELFNVQPLVYIRVYFVWIWKLADELVVVIWWDICKEV